LKVSPSVLRTEAVGLMSKVEVPMVCAAIVMKSLCRSISLKIMPWARACLSVELRPKPLPKYAYSSTDRKLFFSRRAGNLR
jgi:hypothetical protein